MVKEPASGQCELHQSHGCAEKQSAKILESNSILSRDISRDDDRYQNKERKESDVNQNKCVPRSFAKRTHSVGQYLNMDGGQKGMTTVI